MGHAVRPPSWHVFHTHKHGNKPEEYEDAFAGDAARRRFAISDGASESSFVAEWARLLCEGFVAAQGRPWRQLDWLAPQRRRWADEVDGRPLPWYAEEKREQGAYATLLGIAFRAAKGETRPAVWRALAVGDSCLFRLSRGWLRLSFPLRRAAEFSNLPGLLGSRGRAVDTPAQAVRHARGRWRPGDRFLLMTDALAEWMLRRTEEGHQPAADIDALLAEPDPAAAFADWVAQRRKTQGLRNDDTTLLVIDL